MGRYGQLVDRVERTIIAFLMGTMVLASFAQVIARYVFNTGWLGALELTRILFAWLVLFGMAYGVKIGAHLGVDTFIRAFPKPVFRAFAIFGALCGVLYAAIFFSADWLQIFGLQSSGGAFSYWLRTFQTGIGLHELRYPEWAQHTFGLPARVHRWVAYFILPLGLALLALRCAQGAIQIWRGEREMITIAHESGELMDEETFGGTHENPPASLDGNAGRDQGR